MFPGFGSRVIDAPPVGEGEAPRDAGHDPGGLTIFFLPEKAKDS
jgi:hypothetical protein